VSGHWALSVGGDRQLCSGGHFTTGPVWKFWVGLVAKKTVCSSCADAILDSHHGKESA